MLGPLLFILYIDELADIAQSMGVSLQAYADDIQVYLHCKIPAIVSTIETLQHCIEVICNWMASSRLKLNVDKTEVLWLGTNSSLQKLSLENIALTVGSSTVTPAANAKLLGVLMTPDLSLAKHVSAVIVRVVLPAASTQVCYSKPRPGCNQHPRPCVRHDPCRLLLQSADWVANSYH